MDEKIIWVGNRESEILFSDLFYKSITIYGNGRNNNIAYNTCNNKSILSFFIDEINNVLKNDNIKLMFYSSFLANKIVNKAPTLEKYIINKVNTSLLNIIDDKTYAHLWANNMVPTIEFTEMFGCECTYDNIQKKFENYEKFVIQENHSAGGRGTILLNENNNENVLKILESNESYIVSPFYENSFSVNIHVLISNSSVFLLPPSIQIIENINDNLMYKGADYIEYKNANIEVKNKVKNYANRIGNALLKIGYKGVLGIDFLVKGKNVYFLEINPRFQASSVLINKALKEQNRPDLQTIVFNIFNNCPDNFILNSTEKLCVNYSTLSFYQNNSKNYNEFLINALKNSSEFVEYISEENIKTNISNEYMFRAIFNTNISSINYDGEIFVYQNLLNYSYYTLNNYKNNKALLKCALLTQGVVINSDVYQLFNDEKIKEATFDAVDIEIDGQIINCPVKTKFVELSPFCIKKNSDFLELYYLNNLISKVKISLQEKLPIKNTKNNIYIHRIGYLTTDRLRIKHTSCCQFKKENKGCKFCHITDKYKNDYSLEDIYETIDCYINTVEFRHFLIGGPSNTYDFEGETISCIIEYIRNKSQKPIYIMSIPPKKIHYLKKYHELGANEIAFNIEIFNRDIAKALMPGKGEIPIKQYEIALKESAKFFGTSNTRSMLLIGLDSKCSLLEGIEFLCKIGVTPMISPFRAMFNTELENFVPPTIDYIFDVYLKAKKICENYSISLGPECKYCQNNTIV